MKLSDVFDSLAGSELNTLSCVKGGVVPVENYKRIALVVNRGIIKLATRFTLKKSYLTLQTKINQSVYVLDSEHTVSSGNANAYIIDSVDDPFNTEDLLEILSITDLKDKEIPLDGSGDVMRTAINTLRFKPGTKEDVYTLVYSALPARIDINDLEDPENITVDLPLAYLNALMYFIASTMHSPTLSGVDGVRASLDMNYHQKYETECQILEARGIDIDEDVATNLFSQRGFI